MFAEISESAKLAFLHTVLITLAFSNFQMAHGGTNFGFYSGANTGHNESDYKADITSYDYVCQLEITTVYFNSVRLKIFFW